MRNFETLSVLKFHLLPYIFTLDHLTSNVHDYHFNWGSYIVLYNYSVHGNLRKRMHYMYDYFYWRGENLASLREQPRAILYG